VGCIIAGVTGFVRRYMNFFKKKQIRFTSVDTRGHKIRLARAWIVIPPEYHIDLQDRLKYKGGNMRDGMADLAANLIDSSYKSMKTKFPSIRHKHWGDKWLSRINLHYAAVDAYVSYEVGRRLAVVNYGQHHLLSPVPCPNCHKGDEEQKGVKRKRF